MSEAALKAVFADRQLTGTYSDGSAWRESYSSTGTLLYEGQEGRLTGRWAAEADGFCTSYDGSNASSGCFQVMRHGANCFDFYGLDEASGKPTTAIGEIREGRGWSARHIWRAISRPALRTSTAELFDDSLGQRVPSALCVLAHGQASADRLTATKKGPASR
ncbi:hypothetical protein [Aurantimonas sp. VKM B-3413]|uniref:hypothetical protein n=1 Tax=Aurantimonas sp. VKM B-3413 TaxID=2779401 RepID=UPI001E4ECD36|nr:hypothetical protein [Aurantimonas sp. VKM B-3413]MCB8838382.1 hypothetical protein [Aurantimonas sp. VKM B-3413]